MMYSSITLYRLPRENVASFLQIQQQAAEIYKHYGTLDDETFAPADLAAKYGCMAFTDTFNLSEGEVLYVGISRFKDKLHHDEVMAKVDSDTRIGELFEQIQNLLDLGRLVRGEFERKV